MGQQQLLLIVLGVIIVGIAIVAGIGLFNSGAEEATKDEVVAQCTNIGANAQVYYKRPKAMGGGELSFSGYKIPTSMKSTLNGDFVEKTAGTQTQYVFTGSPKGTLGYKWTVETTVNATSISSVITETP